MIQIGPDPLFSRYPVRGYRADINLAGETDEVFELLQEALQPLVAAKQRQVAEREKHVLNLIQHAKNQREALLHANQKGAIGKPWLSYCLGQLANQHQGKIVSELTTMPQFAGLTQADSYYQEALAGGLGEALPIALGLQLARRGELIIAAVGDGSYLFANPAVCHHIAEVMKLPVLVVVGNNGGWGAVAGGTKALYPDGYAAKMDAIPATAFSSSPDFAALAASCRAAALTVSLAEDLPGVLEEAVAIIRTRRQSVLVNVELGR